MSNKKELTQTFNHFKIRTFVELSAAALFTVLNISFNFDISLLAFPLSLAYLLCTCFFVVKKIIVETDGKYNMTAIKLTEYLPYFLFVTFILRRAGNEGTPFIVDVFAVISWFVIFVLAYLNARIMYPKKNEQLVKGWKIVPVEKNLKGWSRVTFEIIDWIDSFFWAIFTVLIFQIFFMQLYEIPSESMVPTFVVKDRVFVSKIDCGPKFPLTDVGLPDFRTYKRGDTIVIRNPHYSMDRKSEVKTVTANLIRMLTLTTVNLNKEEDGELKADPLVKRITGLPGEQLVMQDGTLYRRTLANDVFEPVELDSKYAAWNLNTVSKNVKPFIQRYPLSSSDYQKMLDFEEQRRNYDFTVAEFQARELVRRFNRLTLVNKDSGNFTKPGLYESRLFSYEYLKRLTKDLRGKAGGAEWFSDFMTSWIYSKNNERDVYSQSNYTLNVMTKITLGNLIVEMAELMSQEIPESKWGESTTLVENYANASTLDWYIQGHLDSRNMPVFPANDKDGNPQYIPSNCYFMMGDNRFNSLDLRHSYEYKEKALTTDDPLSVTYYSNMEPQYINKKYIIGKPALRFWPLGRFGKV